MNLKQVGRELIRMNIGNAFKAALPVRHDSYRGGAGFWMFSNDGNGDVYFNYNGLSSSLTAFEKCAPLNAIISKKVKAYLNGKTWVLNNKGKEIENEPAARLKKLLQQPNPLQTWPQFEAQAKYYREIFGFNIILDITPAGYDRTYAKSIWNLPPHYIEIQYTNTTVFKIKDKKDLIEKIWFKTPDGNSTTLDKNLVTIQAGLTPSFTSPLLSESPIPSLTPQINNVIGAYESRGSLISYRGALGAFTQEIDPAGTRPMSKEEKDDVQKDFMKYGLLRGQHKFIISSASLKWQQIGIPTKELMLFEEIEDDIMRMADSFGYPYRLLAAEKSASYNDVKEFKKDLYQDTIIPEATYDYQFWTSYFSLENYRLHLDKDYSAVPALQQNKKELASARLSLGQALDREFRNNWITLNRVLELMEEDSIGEEGNKYYRELIELGWTFGQAVTQQNNQNESESNQGSGNKSEAEA